MSSKAKISNVNDNYSPGPEGGSDDFAAIAIDRFLGLSSEDMKLAPMVTGAGVGTDIGSQHGSELSYLDVIRSKYLGLEASASYTSLTSAPRVNEQIISDWAHDMALSSPTSIIEAATTATEVPNAVDTEVGTVEVLRLPPATLGGRMSVIDDDTATDIRLLDNNYVGDDDI